MVDNNWDTAIRAEFDKPGLFLDVLQDTDVLTCVLRPIYFF